VTPPPFYRTFVFWCGLPVLLALLWGWLAFPTRGSEIRWGQPGKLYSIGDYSRVIVIGVGTHPGTIVHPHGLSYLSSATSPGAWSEDGDYFPSAWTTRLVDMPTLYQSRGFSIAYWFLIACHLAVWLPLLVWWQRRALAKSTALTTTIPA
jgi:hypothetical protein